MIGRQWTRCRGRMERVLVKSEDWMPDSWVLYSLVLSGAGAVQVQVQCTAYS